MSETQKAMFYIHEITYKLARHFSGSKFADTSRYLTAKLFADNSFDLANEDISKFIWQEKLKTDESEGPFGNDGYWVKEPIFIEDQDTESFEVDLLTAGWPSEPQPWGEVRFKVGCHDGQHFGPVTPHYVFNLTNVEPTKKILLPSTCRGLFIYMDFGWWPRDPLTDPNYEATIRHHGNIIRTLDKTAVIPVYRVQ